MAFSASLRERPVASINITPLVDVMLVLLIIFMVSAPLLSRPLPAALEQAGPVMGVAPPVLLLEVAGDGSYRLDGRQILASELALRLSEAGQNDPRTVLGIQASAEADYQAMVGALASAHAGGLTQIAIRP